MGLQVRADLRGQATVILVEILAFREGRLQGQRPSLAQRRRGRVPKIGGPAELNEQRLRVALRNLGEPARLAGVPSR